MHNEAAAGSHDAKLEYILGLKDAQNSHRQDYISSSITLVFRTFATMLSQDGHPDLMISVELSYLS